MHLTRFGWLVIPICNDHGKEPHQSSQPAPFWCVTEPGIPLDHVCQRPDPPPATRAVPAANTISRSSTFVPTVPRRNAVRDVCGEAGFAGSNRSHDLPASHARPFRDSRARRVRSPRSFESQIRRKYQHIGPWPPRSLPTVHHKFVPTVTGNRQEAAAQRTAANVKRTEVFVTYFRSERSYNQASTLRGGYLWP